MSDRNLSPRIPDKNPLHTKRMPKRLSMHHPHHHTKVVYIAGPYGLSSHNLYAPGMAPTDLSSHNRDPRNIDPRELLMQQAREIAAELWQAELAVVCPLLNTDGLTQECPVPYEDFHHGNLSILARCDAVVMMPGWESSKYARSEYMAAVRNTMPIFIYPDYPTPG